MNFRMIKNILGWILIFEAGFMLIPVTTALIYKEQNALLAFLASMGICLAVGLLGIIGKPKNTSLYSKDGFVIVALSWIILSIFGAIPFTISGDIPNYINALFEMVSGFTTTGSSVLFGEDYQRVSHATLIWRSFSNWIGGMGVLVFIMAFIPLSGGNNMHIMKAESPGPSVGKLVPKVKTTAAILYMIYIGLTLLQFVILLFGNLIPNTEITVFEALCAAFSTAGTGGFATRADGFHSYAPYIQIVVTVFMLLFSINFTSYYLIMLRRFKEAFNSEVRGFLYVVIGAIAVITFNTWLSGISEMTTPGSALLHSSFTVASIISTSGFATVDFTAWPELSRYCLLLLMFIGACAGSTGGGIKISRILIMLKSVAREFHLMIHPKQIKAVTVDKKPIDNELVRSTNVYMLCYLTVFVISVFLMCINPNNSFMTALSSVTTAINNIGPGLSFETGPNGSFAHFHWAEKLLLSFNMLAGRLELFPMLILFSPTTWKK